MNVALPEQVMASYAQIDRQTEAFQVSTQLHCPVGCGWCCESPNVEATLLEMLPLALELFRRGEVDFWLEKLRDSDNPECCIFYKPDPLIPGNGRCQVYAWRPSICRLFGWSAVTNKSGQCELAACIRHKEIIPEIVAKTQEAITKGLPVPNMVELSQQVANIDPELGRQRMPINQALLHALERVGLMVQLGGEIPK